MILIGMLDSPFVRRVAVSLQLLGLPFEHRALSVFRDMDAFRRINPAVKAPTLVCDDGTVLMDSTLILDYAESLAHPRTLMPSDSTELRHALRAIGLALIACEKCVQIVYEREQRPPDKVHEPWLDRITGQMTAAFGELESEIAHRKTAVTGDSIDQAGISAAVAWYFALRRCPDALPAAAHPSLAALSDSAETLPAFIAAPYSEEPVTVQTL